LTCLIVLWVTFKFALGFLTNHKADLAAECLGQSNDFSLIFLADTPINEALQAQSEVIKSTNSAINFFVKSNTCKLRVSTLKKSCESSAIMALNNGGFLSE
jgi:hypothetical protein